jgi:Tfp pilus assembly protein PilV
MGRRTILKPIHSRSHPQRQGGWSLIEATIALFLLMSIALFGMKTMVSAFLLQNWSIGQSMTDAQAGIESAYAQRWVFASLPDPRWPVYPLSATTLVTIGYMPSLSIPLTAPGPQVTATVIRTCRQYTQDAVTGAYSYLLESYVVYQTGQRKYCKVSKVYRDQ